MKKPRKHRNQRKKGDFSGIGIAVLVLFVSVLALEAILRTWYSQFPDPDIEFWRYETTLQILSNDPRGYVQKPRAGMTVMKSLVETNSRGFRSPEFPPKKQKGTYRFFVLGNSSVLGWGVPESKTMVRLLDQRFNGPRGRRGKFRKIEFINAAVADYRLEQQLFSFLIELSKLEPDAILLCVNMDDARVASKHRFNPIGRSSFLAASLRKWARSFLRLFQSEDSRIAETRALYTGTNWLRYRSNTAELVHELRDRKIRLIPIIMPEIGEMKSYPYNGVHWKIANLFVELGHYPLDLLPSLKHSRSGELGLTDQDHHPNERANALMAKAIGDWIEKRGLIR